VNVGGRLSRDSRRIRLSLDAREEGRMTIPEAEPSPVLPIWRGRRGAITLAFISVLALVCGLGLMEFAERFGVVPACRGYAQAQGWQYVSYRTYDDSLTNRSGAICAFKDQNGSPTDVYVRDISLLTNFWVSFAVRLVITVPTFVILFAIVRTWLYRRSAASK
jgi:hypothetical protein